MFKFHIDLAEEAAKTLRANFLETNLTAVIFIAGLTLPLSDSLTFSILPPPSSLLSSHPFALSRSPVNRFQQPRTFLSQFVEQVQSRSSKVCCIFTCNSLHLLRSKAGMLRMLTNPAASEVVSVTVGCVHPPPTTLLLLLISCGIYRLVFLVPLRLSKHKYFSTDICGEQLVCSSSSRFWGIIPQVRAVHDNVPCNKAQESPVASLMPGELVTGWMVLLVESGFATFCGHKLTTVSFLFW